MVGPAPPASTRMFAGLTSRCTSPAVCAASSAEATGETNSAARPGGSGPSRLNTRAGRRRDEPHRDEHDPV